MSNRDEPSLVLAAEDFEQAEFDRVHRFSKNDERVISKLIAHGPVLLQGSRGSGKSALMRAAAERLLKGGNALGVYISLRHMPLLRSSGDEYHRILCEIVTDKLQRAIENTQCNFDSDNTLTSLQIELTNLSEALGKRIVLMFDDAAHIGREASLGEFFDVFRTLSSSSVSCKATIYPGVTNFGKRFDVYNDATVVDVIRDEDQDDFGDVFTGVIQARFPSLVSRRFSSEMDLTRFAWFLGKSVLGNMRSFIFACNSVADSSESLIGLSSLTNSFLELANNFYWPLLEEVKPKLGKYTPVVDISVEIGESLFEECGREKNPSVIIHREIIARLAKAFEILEYVGFLSKREASKGMKSGGRGSRYALNLCLLLEKVPGSRLTSDLFEEWCAKAKEPIQLHIKGALFSGTKLPPVPLGDADLQIFDQRVDALKKSKAYPYGLSEALITRLIDANIKTVGDLYSATEEELDAIDYIGETRVKQMKNLVSQAIWL